MTPIEFLRALWPATGLYCLATPRQEGGFRHTVVDSIEDAARYAESRGRQQDVFFCMHTLTEQRRANPDKASGYEVRTHANMHAVRCFFLDLDVGEAASKYRTQSDALAALREFCHTVALPKPLITSSGGGLHVYWCLTNCLPSLEWRAHALKLKALANHHGLRADPTRIADQSSVLRVAGTFNLKGGEIRPVVVLTEGTVTDTQEFLRLVAAAAIRSGVASDVARSSVPLAATGLGSNLRSTFDGPAPSMKALLTACPQLLHLATNPAEQTQPSWYAALGAIRFVEDGDKWAHKFSDVHRKGARTDEKLAQLAHGNFGPTTCAKLADVCGEEKCLTCPFFKHAKVRSPVTAARFRDEAPPAVVVRQCDTTSLVAHETVQHEIQIPPPPSPYTRLKSGGISMHVANPEGDPIDTVIYEYDLHPVHIAEDSTLGQIQIMWRAMLPHQEPRDFALASESLYDMRAFTKAITSIGVYPDPHNLSNVQAYMTAYVQALQRAAANEHQYAHLGWTDAHDGFVLADKMLLPDGTAKPVRLTSGAQTSSQAVGKEGTLARQVELLKFYDAPEYVGHQFFILAALAAPIFFATGHHGVIVNASGEAGSSKSTALATGASFWGDPTTYPINGTNKGGTALFRVKRAETLANLPVCVDEITHLPVKEAVDLAMGISQVKGREGLYQSGEERRSTKAQKSTIMMTTANNSLHGLLSLHNAAGTAGSMRVLEIVLPKSDKSRKPEADQFLRELKLNYGHIGEAFMTYVMQHHEMVKLMVETTMASIDAVAGMQASERFWSAEVASALVAGEIAVTLGLLSFDIEYIHRWVLTTQIPGMRETVGLEYRSPVSTLAEFLEHIDGNMLVLPRQSKSSNLAHPIRAPRGELMARYEVDEHTMWVLGSAFKDYCAKTGASASFILKALKSSKVVRDSNARKVLGANCPEYSKAQTYCICIDMSHHDMSGVADLKVVGGTHADLSSIGRQVI